jgi:putative DNA primase/helicase
MSELLIEARRLRDAGLSIIPVRTDGSKAPALPWKAYQSRLPTEAELREWFGHPGYGLAIVCGAISDNLEIIDFDASDLFAL